MLVKNDLLNASGTPTNECMGAPDPMSVEHDERSPAAAKSFHFNVNIRAFFNDYQCFVFISHGRSPLLLVKLVLDMPLELC
jgi:hypothetical protein